MERDDAGDQKREQVRGVPVGTADGRNVDPRLGALSGEAAEMRVARPDEAWPVHAATSDAVGAWDVAREGDTYYGLPAIKAPVWKGYIPLYFWVGGATGAALVLGAASQAIDARGMRKLVATTRWFGAAGTMASAALLIVDLGRPSLFLNMLRVFRPTSPMNLGSWVLSMAGATSATAAIAPVLGSRRLGDAAGYAAGLAGLPLAGYTAVLLSNTVVPVWKGARRSLPWLFVASGVVAAASLLELAPLGVRERRVVHAFGIAGRVAELAASRAMERELGREPRVARPLHRGRSGAMHSLAKGLSLASLALALGSERSRARRVAGAVLGVAGTLALRFAVLEAGKASARDPRATFEPQRDALAKRAADVDRRSPVRSAGPRPTWNPSPP